MLVSLQLGRGLAALAVAAFHLSIVLGSPEFGGNGANPYWAVLKQGNLGVDFFFVLSGFIILKAHHQDIGNPSALPDYAYRRFVRIYPIYWLYLILCILGMLAVGSKNFKLDGLLDWLTTFSLLRFNVPELPLAQAWTLFHELVFYALFAVLLVQRTTGYIVLGVWFATVAILFTYPRTTAENFTQVLTAANNLNFAFGMLAFAASSRLAKAQGWGLMAFGLVLFFAVAAWRGSATPAPWMSLVCGVSFAVVIAGAAASERPSAWRAHPLLILIGDASYSIYLVHEHVESYAVRGLLKLGLDTQRFTALSFVLVMGMVTAVGVVAYLLFERPLLRALRR
jgi:exopolysaccharide production protein ExoZ